MARKTSEKQVMDNPEQLQEQETMLLGEAAFDEDIFGGPNADPTPQNTPTSTETGAPQAEQEQPPEEGTTELSAELDEEMPEPADPTDILTEADELPIKLFVPTVEAAEPESSGIPEITPETTRNTSKEPEQKNNPAAKKTKPRTPNPNVDKPAKTKKMQTDTPNPSDARRAFYSLDFRALDRDLSPEQEQEWNSIYASFRSGSILTGTVVGVDEHTLDITDGNGDTQRRTVQSLVIIDYRVKVIIPETEIWAVGEENSHHATRSMVGAKVDYVILNVDRENDCAIASRRMAMTKKRRHFPTAVRNSRGLVKCDVLLVAPKVLLVNCSGFDLILTQKDLSYTAIADLREQYKPGQELMARLLDLKDGKPAISVKEVNPNPFDGAELRHPVGCRRQAEIEGKYAGGVFCRLPDNTTCLCLYSNNHFDTEFYVGDTVLIFITEYDNNRKLIYGRIVAKR